MTTTSVKDVAQLAGVSVGTVSNVLNHPERVSARTIERVNDAIGRLGFLRNAAASQLRAGLSRSVGLIVLDASNPFFADLARGAEDHAAAHGISVLVGNSGGDAAREAGYLDLFEEQRVRGVLLSPVGDSSARLERLRERGIAAVLVDRATDGAPFSSVAVDDVAGGRAAAGHLAERGRRRVAFVGGPLHLRQVADRLEGARLALGEAGLEGPEVIETPGLSITAGREAGLALGRRIAAAGGSRSGSGPARPDAPDAVFAANDVLALGLLQGLMLGGGVRVPEDVALVGYDDIPFAASAMVPLTSVRQNAAELGRTAMELLLEEAGHGPGFTHRQLVAPPGLVVRASS
ncbi:LacI family DNA-binding transcriptional regulator [Zafaria sp. Z1313]|uniref:LacI family DNA-binding transcriptional regulator n=1 Tax=Zafaria sp. Z1313 TaxID=3423202 RepID=UPI003D3023F5